MRDKDLIAFAERDREAVTRADEDHWRRRKQALGALEGLRAAAMLRQHVLSLRPDWPSAEERASDLAHHVHLGETLRRVRREPAG